MITGVLILSTSCNYDLKSFYSKRILKVFYPLLFWGGVYSTLPFVLGIQDFTSSFVELILVPFVNPKEIGGILWYLYILIGIYLVIPFISPKLYINRVYQLCYLIFWALSSLVFMVQNYEPNILGINQWEHNVHSLSYFWGYFGFCILGLYFSNSIYKLGSCMAIVSYLTICLLIFLGQRYGDINFSHYVSSFISIPSILMTLILFLYIKGIKINISSAYFKAIKNLSSLSFGIYLSHMVIYRCITANIYEYSTSWIFQILVFVTTFLGAWCLSFILSKFPFSKYIVGV